MRRVARISVGGVTRVVDLLRVPATPPSPAPADPTPGGFGRAPFGTAPFGR